MELGSMVARERCRRGLTQAELARGASLSQATISRLESGHISEIRPTHLVGLADCLGLSADYLLGRTDQLEAEEVLLADRAGRGLVDTYVRLTSRSRNQLVAFARFLENEEEPCQ